MSGRAGKRGGCGGGIGGGGGGRVGGRGGGRSGVEAFSGERVDVGRVERIGDWWRRWG